MTATVTVTVNGEPSQIQEGTRLSDLIADMQLKGKRFAIERNQEIVPKSTLDTVYLEAGDVVEVVQAIGGG